MNLTDVGHLTSDADTGEDKMELAVKKEHKTAGEIADFYANAFFKDTKKLNIIYPNIVCKATDHIKDRDNRKIREKGVDVQNFRRHLFQHFKIQRLRKTGKTKKRRFASWQKNRHGRKKEQNRFRFMEILLSRR